MTIEAYRIAVKMSLTNNISESLASMAKDFAKTEAQATLLQKRLNGIQSDFIKGGLAIGAGFGIFALMKAPLNEAKKFQDETARFASLGFGDKVTSQAAKFAEGMKTVGTSATQNMSLVSDAMAVFKDLEHAKFAAPIMSKMQFANSTVFGTKGGEHSTKFMDMLKVIEFRRGLSSEKEFETQANYVQQVITGSRNRVDATQLLSALKTGGVALTQRTNKDFYLGSEPLIQEFGGQRYGTGAMSIYQNLVQARGSITSQQELFRLGLLNPQMVKFNALGNLKKALPGSFYGSEVLEKEGELALLEKVLLPAFAKKGITGEESVIRELGAILGNRTGSSLMSRIYQQRGTLHTMIDANVGAENINQLTKRASGMMGGKVEDLHAKYADLMLKLGNTILPLAIRGLSALIPMIEKTSAFIERHTMLVKGLASAFVTLGIGLAIHGTVKVLTASLRGLELVLGFSKIGGIVGLNKTASAIGGVGTQMGIMSKGLGAMTKAFSVIAWAELGLTIAKILGLPDTNRKKGMEDVRRGNWLAASADLPAMDFFRAVGHRIGQIDLTFGSANSTLGVDKKGGFYDMAHQQAVAAASKNRTRSIMDDYPTAASASNSNSPRIDSVRPAAQNKVSSATSDVYLDSAKVGKVVFDYGFKNASSPFGGISGFDMGQSLISPGMAAR